MADLTDLITATRTAVEAAATPVNAYFANIPQSAQPPYVRWEFNSQEDGDLRVYGSHDEGEAAWINVHVWGTSMEEAVAIHDSMSDLLAVAEIAPIGYVQMRKPWRETSQPLPDVESGLFRMWSRWSLRFCKP